jgi:uncharacterized coiled-coil protein SlyX
MTVAVADAQIQPMAPGRRRDDDGTPSPRFLWQAIRQNDDKAEAAHERLRRDHREYERRIDLLETSLDKLTNQLTRLEATPVNATSLIFSTQSVGAIVMAVATVIGGSYLVNWGQRSELREMRIVLEERSKTQDKTNGELREAVAGLQRDLKATEDRLRGEIRLQSEFSSDKTAKRRN